MTPLTFDFERMYAALTELGRAQLHLRNFFSQGEFTCAKYAPNALTLQYKDSFRSAQELGPQLWALTNLLKGDKALSRDRVCDLPQGEIYRIRLLLGQLTVLADTCQEIWQDIQKLPGNAQRYGVAYDPRSTARIAQRIHDTAAANVRLILEAQDALELVEQNTRQEGFAARANGGTRDDASLSGGFGSLDIPNIPDIPDDWTLMCPNPGK